MFVFAQESGFDIVEDFQDGVDRINLTDLWGSAIYITDTADGALVNVEGYDMALFKGVSASELAFDDLVF